MNKTARNLAAIQSLTTAAIEYYADRRRGRFEARAFEIRFIITDAGNDFEQVRIRVDDLGDLTILIDPICDA